MTNLRGARVDHAQLAKARTLEGATLPNDLRAAREGAGLSRKALAERVGVSESTAGRWEREGPMPGSAKVRAKVAEVLGVDPWAEDEPEAGS
jgi:transcriptional regulator with XRE-family HTH domain